MTKKELKDKEAAKMRLLFMYMWSKWDKYSDISGKYVGSTYSNVYFHHIFPKSRFDKLKYLPYNIIRVTADEHHAVEDSPKHFKVVNDRRKEILDNYEHFCNLAERFEREMLEPLYELTKDKKW